MNGTLLGKLSLVGLLLLLGLSATLYFAYTPAPRRSPYADAAWNDAFDKLQRLQPPAVPPSAAPAAPSAADASLARWHQEAAASAEELTDALRNMIDLEREQSASPQRKLLQADLAELLIDYETSFALLKLHLATGSARDRAAFEKRWQSALAAQDRFAPSAALWSSRQAALWQSAGDLRRQLEPIPARLISARAAIQPTVVAPVSAPIASTFKQDLSKAIDETRQQVDLALQSQRQSADQQRESVNRALLIGLLATALISITALGWAFHSIAQPIRFVRQIIGQWSSGKGAGPRRIEPVSDDELGLLASDLNQLVEQVRRTISETSTLSREIVSGVTQQQELSTSDGSSAAGLTSVKSRQNASRLASMLQKLQSQSGSFKL